MPASLEVQASTGEAVESAGTPPACSASGEDAARPLGACCKNPTARKVHGVGSRKPSK